MDVGLIPQGNKWRRIQSLNHRWTSFVEHIKQGNRCHSTELHGIPYSSYSSWTALYKQSWQTTLHMSSHMRKKSRFGNAFHLCHELFAEPAFQQRSDTTHEKQPAWMTAPMPASYITIHMVSCRHFMNVKVFLHQSWSLPLVVMQYNIIISVRTVRCQNALTNCLMVKYVKLLIC